MTEQQMEQLMDEMADFTAEQLSKEEEIVQKAKLSETLKKVIFMLRSKDFTRKCKEDAKKYGVNEAFVKNAYASRILNNIGEGTSIVITGIGEAFNYLVRLLSFVLQKIMDFAVSAIVKLVNFVTLRKEAI